MKFDCVTRLTVGGLVFFLLFAYHLLPETDNNMKVVFLRRRPSKTSQNLIRDELNGNNILSLSNNTQKYNSGSCDLDKGKWVYDPSIRPLYTSKSCSQISRHQNCQSNGRPDKEYENWRWQPDQCQLMQLNARRFLELMRGKTIAFIGDSLARNQMESLLCILWQVEEPKNHGNRHRQQWDFRSTSTTLVRIWSSWLVHSSNFNVSINTPDESFMNLLPKFDVVVISSGHWYSSKCKYTNGTKSEIDDGKAYEVAMETALTAIAVHENYTGLTVLRSYSPDHYAGRAWNTGGSCRRNVRPAAEPIRNEYTNAMHAKQVVAFERAKKRLRKNGSKMKLMDVTEMFGYRHDGHPGPYNLPGRRASRSKMQAEDCLHWCLPGPIDTWNDILFEIIKREL